MVQPFFHHTPRALQCVDHDPCQCSSRVPHNVFLLAAPHVALTASATPTTITNVIPPVWPSNQTLLQWQGSCSSDKPLHLTHARSSTSPPPAVLQTITNTRQAIGSRCHLHMPAKRGGTL